MANLRELILGTAIKITRAANQPLDLEHVAVHLPADFDLSQAEIDALAPAPTPLVEVVVEDEIEHVDPVVADEPEPVQIVEDQPAPTTLSPNEASEGLIAARLALPQALDRQRRARAILADRVRDYRLAMGQPVNQEQLCRQHAQSEQEIRRQRVMGRGPAVAPQHPGGPSLLDQQMLHSKSRTLEGSGNVGTHGQVTGKRGAYSAAHDQRLVKLPSQS